MLESQIKTHSRPSASSLTHPPQTQTERFPRQHPQRRPRTQHEPHPRFPRIAFRALTAPRSRMRRKRRLFLKRPPSTCTEKPRTEAKARANYRVRLVLVHKPSSLRQSPPPKPQHPPTLGKEIRARLFCPPAARPLGTATARFRFPRVSFQTVFVTRKVVNVLYIAMYGQQSPALEI
jgi:hypothetical protein